MIGNRLPKFYEEYEKGESVYENGDESGLRVEITPIVHRSRRRYRPPKGWENGGEVIKDSNPLQRLELSKKTFCQI